MPTLFPIFHTPFYFVISDLISSAGIKLSECLQLKEWNTPSVKLKLIWELKSCWILKVILSVSFFIFILFWLFKHLEYYFHLCRKNYENWECFFFWIKGCKLFHSKQIIDIFLLNNLWTPLARNWIMSSAANRNQNKV